jgi:hypothetical protein
MSATSTCPKCLRQVTIPDGADLAATVRCPLCGGEFSLHDALAPLPPELIMVQHPETTEAAGNAGAESASDDEYALASDEYSIASDHASVEEGPSTISFAEGPVSFRPLRKPKPTWQAIFEIVSGGLAGTLFAYYALAWYQGPAFDLPKIGLPWIEKLTAKPPLPPVVEKNVERNAERKIERDPATPRNVPYAWPPVPGEATMQDAKSEPPADATDGETDTDDMDAEMAPANTATPAGATPPLSPPKEPNPPTAAPTTTPDTVPASSRETTSET